MHERSRFGQSGEELACAYLQRRRYTILARNVRRRMGEIDIVAHDPRENMLVFVEVKTRRSAKYGTPAEAVTPQKQRSLIYTAELILVEKNLQHMKWRIDVVGIVIEKGSRPVIRHIKNAVSYFD